MSQQEITYGPMPIADIEFLPWDTVKLWKDEHEAIVMSWARRQNRRMSIEKGAERMGIAKSTLSKYMNGHLMMSPDRREAFERVVGHRGLTQYAAYQAGFTLTQRKRTEQERKDQEIADLRAELAAMKGKEAMTA